MKKPFFSTLVVQIPAYNEEASLAKVIAEIPRSIPGIKEIKILVIDDGSKDKTSEVAKKAGADVVIRNIKNQGLAYTFQRGLQKAIEMGADIIVNTDADFQYNQQEIPRLLRPILDGKADIVSGNRQVEKLGHMTFAKKYGNIVGSNVVRYCAGYGIIDASSGFRAYSREAALRLFVTSSHTYTHETLIQAAHKRLRVVEIPVEFRERVGESKLIKTVYGHIKKSMATIVRSTLMYNSFKAFSLVGTFLILAGLVPMIRWFWLSYVYYTPGQHIQSLLLGSLLMIAGGLSVLLGFIADLLAINRRYLEEILYDVRRDRYA